MRKRNNNYPRKVHLFTKEPEYLMKYLDMLKQEKYWRNNGQYFMAKECERRASYLQNENIGAYESYRKTEELYCPTKKSNIDTYNRMKENVYTNMNIPSNRKMDRRFNNRSYNNFINKRDNNRTESKNWRE